MGENKRTDVELWEAFLSRRGHGASFPPPVRQKILHRDAETLAEESGGPPPPGAETLARDLDAQERVLNPQVMKAVFVFILRRIATMLDRWLSFLPAPVRQYLPAILAAVTVLIGAGFSALGIDVDLGKLLEVVLPAGMAVQVIVMRQQLAAKGSNGKKTLMLAGAALVTIAASVGLSIWQPTLAPLVTQVAGALLGILGLGATAAATAAATKVPG